MVEKKKKTSRFISEGLVAENRKARFNYAIEDTVEAGLELVGSEVKSIRTGKINITEGFVVPKDNELFLENVIIQKWGGANQVFDHVEKRKRRLLLHKKEIGRLIGKYNKERITIVPLKVYFNKKGLAKVLLGVGKGKQTSDKRDTIKKRDWDKQKGRIMREKG